MCSVMSRPIVKYTVAYLNSTLRIGYSIAYGSSEERVAKSHILAIK